MMDKVCVTVAKHLPYWEEGGWYRVNVAIPLTRMTVAETNDLAKSISKKMGVEHPGSGAGGGVRDLGFLVTPARVKELHELVQETFPEATLRYNFV